MHRESWNTPSDADVMLRQAASDGRLWSLARGRAEAGDRAAELIEDVCGRIHASTVAEGRRLSALPGAEDIEVTPDPSGQLHLLTARCRARDAAMVFSAELVRDGYLPWQHLDGAAEEVFFRTNTQRTFVHLGDVTRTVVVQWPENRFGERLPRALRPTVRDWEAVSLPRSFWWGYFAVRPARLIRERLTGTDGPLLPLGPILGTPTDLIGPLLRFAELESDDHLVDLGCGDGRVIIAAVEDFACQATGVEQDVRLVERARQRIGDAGLQDRLVVHHANADTFDLGEATVVFLFIPAEAVGEVAEKLRARGFSGRIISHEQRFIDGPISPMTSSVLLGESSLTVAHRW